MVELSHQQVVQWTNQGDQDADDHRQDSEAEWAFEVKTIQRRAGLASQVCEAAEPNAFAHVVFVSMPQLIADQKHDQVHPLGPFGKFGRFQIRRQHSDVAKPGYVSNSKRLAHPAAGSAGNQHFADAFAAKSFGKLKPLKLRKSSLAARERFQT